MAWQRCMLGAMLVIGCSGARPREPARISCPAAGALPEDELEVVRAAVESYRQSPTWMIEERVWGWEGAPLPDDVRARIHDEAHANQLDKPPRCIPADSPPLPVLRESEAGQRDSVLGFWSWFHDRHPDFQGRIIVSRVGFSADRATAYLRLTVGRGPEGHESFDLWLARRDGRWVIRDKKEVHPVV